MTSTSHSTQALIEVLQTRDIFFVDADVAFKYDPYPMMEPYMKTHDLIAQENDSFDHFNTGWMWIRQSKEASDAWNEVLKMDLEHTSRDQNNFNTVLNTTLARACTENCNWPGSKRPLKMDFMASNGMKVHVLDPAVFRSHHFEADMPMTERHESVSFHMTCGDDAQTKVYVAKAQGFWGNVERYYDAPPQMITIDHLSGTQAELTQLMQILIMAAHYANRALLPPQYATFTDLNKTNSKGDPIVPTRKIYSAFPVSHIEQSLGVHVLEPLYPSYATQWLEGGSVLGLGETRQDRRWSEHDNLDRTRVALSLYDTADLDLRHVRSFGQLKKLMESSSFKDRQIIRLINHDYPPGWAQPLGATNWREWVTEGAVSNLRTCHQVDLPPSCEAICRFDGLRRIEQARPWLTSDEVF